MNRYKTYAMLISSLGLMLLMVGVTYSFFNYTRTGNANNFSVGRISFETNQSSTINLSNVFPIDSNNINTDTDNVGTVVVTITGDTDLDKGIEYLVSSQDTNLTTQSGTLVPLSLNITASGLGDSEPDYYTERTSATSSIYKKLIGSELIGDQMLLVGYIAPNDPVGTPDGIDGSVTIKAYFDKDKILITDTPEESAAIAGNRTILSTSEWGTFNSNGVSFKVKVEANEGIWVNGSLEDIMKKNAVMDNTSSTYVSASTGIDFGAFSSDTNGKGVYTRAGTENDTYPIMYYRGDVTDNNVLFANKCWKAVRTTDTGGVKLIYNGEKNHVLDSSAGIPLEENEYTITKDDYGFTYNQNDKKYVATIPSGSYNLGYFSFTVPDGDEYYAKIEITGNHVNNNNYYYFFIDSDYKYDYVYSYPYEKYWSLGTLTNSNGINFWDSLADANDSSLTVKIQILHDVPHSGQGCDNSGIASQLSLNENGFDTKTFAFNTSYNSPAYVGYMYGTIYAYSDSNWTSGAYFGSGFTWDGTNYKLTDATVTTPNTTHHYSCNSTDANATCTDIRYVYYIGSGKRYYITLTGGDGVEEALVKMNTNTNDSNAKDIIDTWFENDLTNVVDNTKKDYRSYLEDTIWCNDRSMGDNNNNGWIANGGELSKYLYYGAYQRSDWASYTSTVKNQPSLICANKNDRFTVNNAKGNMVLTYPVALLTEDEIVLAGGKSGGNGTSYLKTGEPYWSLSPYSFQYSTAYNFDMDVDSIYYDYISHALGLRPSISIKPGQLITKGTGTVDDPYVIE